MSCKTKLVIKNPPQYDIAIDGSFNESIFIDVYNGAAENIAAIIQKNTDKTASHVEQGINTTVAFVGGRGTGKSSAMYNFRSFLENKSADEESYVWIKKQEIKKQLKSIKFHSLPTIDSSQISRSESVIGRISAAMFEVYKKKKNNLPAEQKQEFIKCAKDVNEIAVMIRESREWFTVNDSLLNNTERIGSMRDRVQKLVAAFLKISEQKSFTFDDSYLVISIDDLDMGVENAYPIMEEIRKYLSIPRVIVLVSIDDQLLNAVMYNSIKNNMDISGQESLHLLKDLSYRYLEKLFPINRRHHMPVISASQLLEWSSGCFVNDTDDTWEALGYEKDETPSILNATLHLIWRKTMLLLVCNENGEHLLIPRNLRSLSHMIVFLRSMPDIAYDADGNIRKYTDFQQSSTIRENLRHNLELFGRYISTNISMYGAPQMSTDSEEHMAEVLENIIQRMLFVPLSQINALIVSDILYWVSQCKEPLDIYHQIFHDVIGRDISGGISGNYEYCDILSPAIRYPDSVSVGDVMYVLGKIDTRSKCVYIRYLVEVIRTLWSIRMTDEFFVNGMINEDIRKSNIENTVTRNAVEDSIKGITISFRNVIGGFFVNPDYKPNTTCSNKMYDWRKYVDTKGCVGETLAKLSSVYKCPKEALELTPQTKAWRFSRNGGRPYYKFEDIGVHDENKVWVHPFAIYTNLLSYSRRKYISEFSAWQNEYYMILPFYSFDFLYRYYEKFHESFRENQTMDIMFAISNMFNNLYVNDITNAMNTYIPKEFSASNITSPIKAAAKIIQRIVTNEQIDIVDQILNALKSMKSFTQMNQSYIIWSIEQLKDAGLDISEHIENHANNLDINNFDGFVEEFILVLEKVKNNTDKTGKQVLVSQNMNEGQETTVSDE